MYITIENKKFSIPKSSLRFLAIQKASEIDAKVNLDTDEKAIDFLQSLGAMITE